MMFQLLVLGDAPAEPVNGASHVKVYPEYDGGVVARTTLAKARAAILSFEQDILYKRSWGGRFEAGYSYSNEDIGYDIYKNSMRRSEVMAQPDNCEGMYG